jgi:predicted RNA-binding Zn-ribbon protein involved in translation (DUF1610 family)
MKRKNPGRDREKEDTIMDEKKEMKSKEELMEQKISEEEMSSVNGGMFEERDYAADGCAATVQFGSNCWGVDGGCDAININYIHAPVKKRCPACGQQVVYMDYEGVNVFYYTCKNCGAQYIDFGGNGNWRPFKH